MYKKQVEERISERLRMKNNGRITRKYIMKTRQRKRWNEAAKLANGREKGWKSTSTKVNKET